MKAADNVKLTIQRAVVPFQWLFVRLPRAFTIPLLVIVFLYFFLLFPLAVNLCNRGIFLVQDHIIRVGSTSTFIWQYLPEIWKSGLSWATVLTLIVIVVSLIASALMTLFLASLGLWLSHWLASRLYELYRRRGVKRLKAPAPVRPQANGSENHSNNPLAGFNRIGIILSGGGAKGAYQAGAMQAIYEFLEQHDAHHKVQMIAATSIGSWNALFWLADLMKAQNGGTSPLEEWWQQVTMEKIILPVTYLPTQQNYFLSNEPWRDDFDALFRGTPAGERLVERANRPHDEDSLRFYFTHCNIGKATLAFSSNRQDWSKVTANLPTRRARPVVAEGSYRGVTHDNEKLTLENIRRDVFCSMDIPPLFPYTAIDDDFFEDGGVIDNLPIRFGTEIEECDLLFILPLNASFERKVDQRSLIRRLARVTEIRQGVLERNSFKMIYLYNELASLRQQLSESKTGKDAAPPGSVTGAGELKALSEKKLANRALERKHNVVHVFSICPAPELMLTTTEFWKTREAGEAFRFMYEATKHELKRFTHVVSSTQIRMALVSPAARDFSNNENVTSDLTADNGSYFDNPKPIHKSTGSVDYQVTYFKDF
jgi:predicted acylesterase/phospholipase RssA